MSKPALPVELTAAERFITEEWDRLQVQHPDLEDFAEAAQVFMSDLAHAIGVTIGMTAVTPLKTCGSFTLIMMNVAEDARERFGDPAQHIALRPLQ